MKLLIIFLYYCVLLISFKNIHLISNKRYLASLKKCYDMYNEQNELDSNSSYYSPVQCSTSCFAYKQVTK